MTVYISKSPQPPQLLELRSKFSKVTIYCQEIIPAGSLMFLPDHRACGGCLIDDSYSGYLYWPQQAGWNFCLFLLICLQCNILMPSEIILDHQGSDLSATLPFPLSSLFHHFFFFFVATLASVKWHLTMVWLAFRYRLMTLYHVLIGHLYNLWG